MEIIYLHIQTLYISSVNPRILAPGSGQAVAAGRVIRDVWLGDKYVHRKIWISVHDVILKVQSVM